MRLHQPSYVEIQICPEMAWCRAEFLFCLNRVQLNVPVELFLNRGLHWW